MADIQNNVKCKINYKIDINLRKRICENALQNGEDILGILIGDGNEEFGYVVGCVRSYQNAILSCEGKSFAKLDWVKELSEICTLMPTGMKICGVCIVSNLVFSSIKELYSDVQLCKHEIFFEQQLVWRIQPEMEFKEKEALVYYLSSNVVEETPIMFDNIYNEFLSTHLTLRLYHPIEIMCEETNNGIVLNLTKKATHFCSKLNNATFYLRECQMLLSDDVTSESCSCLLDGSMKCNQSYKRKQKDVLNVEIVQPLSKNNILKNHSPVICYQKDEKNYQTFKIVADVIVMVDLNKSLSALRHLLIRGLKDQIQAILSCVDRFSEDSDFCIPKIFHFQTPASPCLSTCLYPWKKCNGEIVDVSSYENERKSVLKKLFLSIRRPFVHPNNVYRFQNSPKGDDSYIAVVQGNYSYHHYMQDNFDDNKWGCAYRSFQTIFSWFRHQGYTETSVPDHRSIQEALVKLGDKPKSFIGSKKWIGSFEVNLCLDYFLNVSSKIMTVNTGAELAGKGRELIRHFETQGTPVMIGGGVLAHTIVGVCFNDKTGIIKFLIVDPHYTGGEDINIIIDKGWCGWKSDKFWNQQAHYNLCMPQRPEKV